MSPDIHHSPEHEFEPEFGLPERLPEGERVLWQGSPDTKEILSRVFHIKMLGIYFGLLLAYSIATGLSEGEALTSIAFAADELPMLESSCNLEAVAFFNLDCICSSNC